MTLWYQSLGKSVQCDGLRVLSLGPFVWVADVPICIAYGNRSFRPLSRSPSSRFAPESFRPPLRESFRPLFDESFRPLSKFIFY